MTSPVVTEILVRLAPVEHDDFIDSLEPVEPPVAPVFPLVPRVEPQASLRAAA